MQYATQRLLTHARPGQELKLSNDGKSYVDIKTGWKYFCTVLEFARSATENGQLVQERYGRPYTAKDGTKKYWLSILPDHITINSVTPASTAVYPATSYSGYTRGCKLSDVVGTPLKKNASPYYARLDITIVAYQRRR